MTSAEGLGMLAEAVRYTLATMDAREAGATTLPEPPPPAVIPVMAQLIIGARRAVAEREGITEPDLQISHVRNVLESELEAYTFGAIAADIAAGQSGSDD